MVEPMTLGALAAGLVAAAAQKALEKATDKAVDVAVEATTTHGGNAAARLITWVRHRFADNPELARLEDTPDSQRRQDDLANVIEAELISDPASRAELEYLAAQVRHEQASGNTVIVGDMHADRSSIAAGVITGGATTLYTPGTTDEPAGPPDPH